MIYFTVIQLWENLSLDFTASCQKITTLTTTTTTITTTTITTTTTTTFTFHSRLNDVVRLALFISVDEIDTLRASRYE